MKLNHLIIIGALCGALLIPSSASSWGVVGLGGTGAGGGAATYLSMWDGDQGDSDVLEYGTSSTVDGTVTGGTIGTDYGQTANGYRKTAHNQRILWTVASDAQMKDDVGTVWLSIRPGTIASNTMIFEAYNGASEILYIRVDAAGTITATYRGTGVTSTDTVTVSQWNRVGYAYDAASNKHSIKIGSGSWKEDSESITDMTEAMSTVLVGEYAAGGTETTTVDIDDLYIMSTYQEADPL